MVKKIADNLVLLIVLWVALPLTFYIGSPVLSGASGIVLVGGFLILYAACVFALMWVWGRIMPSAKAGKDD